MRQSPSIVPPAADQDIYLVLDDFGGRIGPSWRETDVEATRLESVVADLLDGQYSNPIRVIAFNTAEGWSRASRKTSPTSCAGVVRSRRAICRYR
jgi:hypothetical protein